MRTPRRRCRTCTARKVRSRFRCRSTATRSISRTADDEASSPGLRPSHCCPIFSCRGCDMRRHRRAAARDSNRTRVSSRGTRTRDCRWTSEIKFGMSYIILCALVQTEYIYRTDTRWHLVRIANISQNISRLDLTLHIRH